MYIYVGIRLVYDLFDIFKLKREQILAIFNVVLHTRICIPNTYYLIYVHILIFLTLNY